MVKHLPAKARDERDAGIDRWVRKIPWKRKWQPSPAFLPGNPMDGGAWWATACGVAVSDTTDTVVARHIFYFIAVITIVSRHLFAEWLVV